MFSIFISIHDCMWILLNAFTAYNNEVYDKR